MRQKVKIELQKVKTCGYIYQSRPNFKLTFQPEVKHAQDLI